MNKRIVFLVILLASLGVAWADPVISEFMASNQTGLQDENGDRPDWVEIRNPDGVAVNMAGWYLTDSTKVTSRWQFPAVTIPARGYLVVFCSGKNRRVVGQNLHTDFDLKASGEYLALIKPDGVTKTTEFSPQYPPQYADISYGTSVVASDTIVLDKPTACRSFVPTSDALGSLWRERIFDDSTWKTGTFAVGYFNPPTALSSDLGINLQTDMQGSTRNSYTRANFTIVDPAKILTLTLRMNYNDGFAVFFNANFATASANGVPAPANLFYNSTCNSHAAGAYENFDVSGLIGALTAGSNLMAIQGLNTSATSPDAFISPQLVARIETASGPTGYLTLATPGAANGGPETVQLPQTVIYSRPAGTFTTAFSLTMSGAVAGQVIRYVIADPTAIPGAGIPEPTLTSTLYSAPISISTTKLIRAAVFDSLTGQQGATVTMQYQLLETGTTNNTSNFSSILPILVLDDHGAGLPVDSGTNTYTTSTMSLYEPVAGVARLTNTPTVFSRAGVHVRGSSSASFPKKSYGMELWDEKGSSSSRALLGMASGSDWVLNGPWFYDDTFIHNAFIYEISRRIGRWAPQTRFVEVFTNSNGGKLDSNDYVGIYVLTEKIKTSSGRLNIDSMQPTDLSGDALTGGYIFKIDRQDPGEIGWTTASGIPISDKFVLVEPKAANVAIAQINYLRDNYVAACDAALTADKNAAFATRNYRKYIDVGSFIDHHILNSLAYNVDALRLSAFYFKPRNGKINAGPIWDFDRSLNSDDARDDAPQSWLNLEYFFTRDWWGLLFRDPDFVQAWVDRWRQLRGAGQPFVNTTLFTLADQQAAQIGNAAGLRDAQKWPDNAADNNTYLNEITVMKSWLSARMSYIDSQMPPSPTVSLTSGVVAPGTLVSLTSGTLRYTINGTDPRPAGGGTVTTAIPYTGPIALNQTTVLTVRRQLVTTPLPGAISINWSAPETRVYLVNEAFAVEGDLGISEINYHPLDATAAELLAVPGATADDFEFIELKNVGTRNVNVFEVQFAATFPFINALKLSPLTLAPGDTALVVRNKAAFEARYGTAYSARIVGEWVTGSLSDNGERIQILARDNTALLDFSYNNTGDWPGRPDGKGSSLEYIGKGFSNVEYGLGINWQASSEVHGSPGFNGVGPINSLVINELLTNSTDPRVDAIELFNGSAAPVNIGGWYLSDSSSPSTIEDFKKYKIPAGTSVAAGGYSVFTEVQFNPNGRWNPAAGTAGPTEFAFDSNRGEDAWLIEADASGKPLHFIDHVSFGAARADESWGRWPNGTGSLYPMQQRTLLDEGSAVSPRPGLGAPNSVPRVGPVILSEIEHSPLGGSAKLEFIEVRNTGAISQSLAHWRLRGAVDYDFSLTQTLAPGALLVVVPFDPADPIAAGAFRAAYSIGNEVTLAGPWTAGVELATSGRVTLYRAEAEPLGEPAFFPQSLEDETHFDSLAPWPSATVSGFSLTRRAFKGTGDVAESWKAEVPTPGSTSVSLAAWRAFYFPAGGPGSGDNEDFDADSMSNLFEFGMGKNPRLGESPVLSAPQLGSTLNGTSLSFTYTHPLDRSGVRYQVLKSGDLLNWTAVNDSVSGSTAESETRRAVETLPAGNGRLFFRLQITVGP